MWVEPYPAERLADGHAAPDTHYELRESVELAFIAALQHLPATQRAVLILREVLGFSAQEVADALDTTVAAVNSALQRARRAVDERLPDRSQTQTLRALDDDELRAIVERYMDAMARGDVERVVAMLTADAAWSMPPLASWFRGADVRVFLENGPLSGRFRWRHLPTRANGQLAVGTYTLHADEGAYVAFSLDVLALRGSRIADVTAFIARSPEQWSAERAHRPPRPARRRRARDGVLRALRAPGTTGCMSRATEDSNRRMLRARDAMDRSYAQPLDIAGAGADRASSPRRTSSARSGRRSARRRTATCSAGASSGRCSCCARPTAP